MTTFAVAAAEAGQRLDVLLAGRLGESRSRAAAAIEADRVTLDGRIAAKADRPRAGQVVAVSAPPEPPETPPPEPPPVRWRDEHLLVVAKPAGMVVHPGAGHPDGTMVDALRAAGIPLAAAGGPQRPGIVHRLDRGTSGLLAVACTDAAHRGLVEALRRREVDREYLALVRGVPSARGARIEGPLGRDPDDRRRFAVVAGGKPAVTHVERVDAAPAPTGGRVALLRCRLETGRTHQIRVHLSEAGHPVIGDTTYGGGGRPAEALGLDRPFLHAARLAFDHPVTGARVALDEPLPADLAGALTELGLAAPPPPSRPA